MLHLVATLHVLAATATDRLRGDDRERGATAVEYGLIVALIAAVIIGVVVTLGTDIRNAFTTVEQQIP